MIRPRSPRLLALGAATALVTLAGCTDNAPSAGSAGSAGSSGSGALAVTSTDSACEVSANQAGSGNLVFNVTNGGSKVTEFYLLADDGLRIVGVLATHHHPDHFLGNQAFADVPIGALAETRQAIAEQQAAAREQAKQMA